MNIIINRDLMVIDIQGTSHIRWKIVFQKQFIFD